MKKGSKIIKKIYHIVAVILLLVLLLTSATIMLSLLPPVQNFVADKLASHFSEKLNVKISIDKFSLQGLFKVSLNGVFVSDLHDDTLMYVSEMEADIHANRLLRNHLRINHLEIGGAQFNMVTYQGDSVPNITRILQQLSSEPDQDTIPSRPFLIDCRELAISNTNFRLINENKKKDNYRGIDYNNMDVIIESIKLRNTSVNGLNISTRIDELAVEEKSGMILNDFSGDVIFSNSGFVIKDLLINTNNSNLDLDLEFQYGELRNFNYFLDSVLMIAVIRPSDLLMSDIGYFAPDLFNMSNQLEFNGLFKGTVTDFVASDFSVRTGLATEFNGRIAMKGLPDFYTTDIDLTIEKLVTSASDLDNFKLPGDSVSLILPDELDQLGVVQIDGGFNGTPYDFVSKLTARTKVGEINTEASLSYDPSIKMFIYDGSVRASDLDLKTLTDYPDLGTADLEIEVDGTASTAEDLDISITGWLESVQFQQNTYDRVVLGGNYKEQRFSGRLFIIDELLQLLIDGYLEFSDESMLMDLSLTLDKANLDKMNLADLSQEMILSTNGNLKVDYSNMDNLEADLKFLGTQYSYGGKSFEVDTLFLIANLRENDDGVLKLNSDLFDLNIKGDFGLVSLVESWEDVIMHYYGHEIPADKGTPAISADFDFQGYNLEPLLTIFAPELAVSPGTEVAGMIRTDNYKVEVRASSDSISYAGLKIEDWYLEFEAEGDEIKVDNECRELILMKNPDAQDLRNDTLGLENVQVSLKSKKQIVDWGINWSDRDSIAYNKGFLTGLLDFHEEDKLSVLINQGEAVINGAQWQLEKESSVSFDTNAIRINDVGFIGDNLGLYINGVYSSNPADTLLVRFDNWQISSFDAILMNYNMDIDGLLEGEVKLSKAAEQTSLLADIFIEELIINGVEMGEADINSTWDAIDEAFDLNLTFSRLGNVEKSQELAINGKIYTGRDDEQFDINLRLDNFNLKVFNPFLEGVASQLAGFSTGTITLTGNAQNPILLGSIDLTRTEFVIDYLNTRYSLSHKVIFDTNRIFIKDADLFDTRGEKALLNASLIHNHFKDMEVDLQVKPIQFLGLETNRYQNEIFYGKGIVTGEVAIKGPFDDIFMNVAVKTEKGTNISLPISYSVDVSQGDFIVFLQDKEVDSLETEDYRVNVKGLNFNLNLSVTPDAELEVYLPSNMGFIKAKGEGGIQMGVDPKGYLTLNGKYVLADGLFNFNLEQLISKRFNIMPGSYIAWNGDLYDADVNISAIYRTKTTLSGLAINLTDEASSEKVVVNCIINLTEDLFNPTIKFGIEFPYLSESMKQNVYAALDTSDAAIMNEQAISLLVLNSFSNSGSTPSNPINTYAILANQLSNMLSKISNDFDIGINYIPGDDISEDEFQVAMSTQLLDDRLIIDGNIDVPTGNNNQYSSNLVGDVYIEYKLTPDGRFRVKAFNRSNNLNTLEQYSPYTQGVGVFFRKEFNLIKEIWKKEESLEITPADDNALD